MSIGASLRTHFFNTITGISIPPQPEGLFGIKLLLFESLYIEVILRFSIRDWNNREGEDMLMYSLWGRLQKLSTYTTAKQRFFQGWSRCMFLKPKFMTMSFTLWI